ncbi:hypothetical protein BT96DRAFT_1063301, partial [Gymnopus androsaceus JB14]
DIWRGTVKGQSVCLKVLRLVVEPDEEVRKKIRKQFCNEAILWRQLKHPNILPLPGVNAELFNPSFCLISPWMANKDIVSYLKQNPKHSRHDVVSILRSFRSWTSSDYCLLAFRNRSGIIVSSFKRSSGDRSYMVILEGLAYILSPCGKSQRLLGQYLSHRRSPLLPRRFWTRFGHC